MIFVIVMTTKMIFFIISASYGGLLGLFIGFSLITAFEFIYFFGVRVVMNLWSNKRKIQVKQVKFKKIEYKGSPLKKLDSNQLYQNHKQKQTLYNQWFLN